MAMHAETPTPESPRQAISRLAVAAALCACLCPAFGGLFGFVLGVLALRQMAVVTTLSGRGLAWLGVLVGGAQVVGLGAAGRAAQRAVDEAHPTAARFMAGLVGGDEAHLLGSTAAGLKPKVTGENRRLYADAFASRLGELKELRPRPDSLWHIVKAGHLDVRARTYVFPVAYDVDFSSGAPVRAILVMVNEAGGYRVTGFKFSSAMLRDVELPMEVMAEAQPELQEFGSRPARPKIREFKPTAP